MCFIQTKALWLSPEQGAKPHNHMEVSIQDVCPTQYCQPNHMITNSTVTWDEWCRETGIPNSSSRSST